MTAPSRSAINTVACVASESKLILLHAHSHSHLSPFRSPQAAVRKRHVHTRQPTTHTAPSPLEHTTAPRCFRSRLHAVAPTTASLRRRVPRAHHGSDLVANARGGASQIGVYFGDGAAEDEGTDRLRSHMVHARVSSGREVCGPVCKVRCGAVQRGAARCGAVRRARRGPS